MALQRVGMHDIGIADIDDPHLGGIEIGDVVFEIIGACMAEGKQGRGLADGPRSHACAGSPLCAKVERRAEDRRIGVDTVPILDIGVFSKGADPHKRQVQPSAVISV